MCNWQDINISRGGGITQINARVISDACDLIRQRAQDRQPIIYSDLMNQLTDKGHKKINRGTIGHIVGEVSNQIAQVTDPSVYPSAIVVRKDTDQPGEGFWGLDMGSNPPKNVPFDHRVQALQQYQNDVFNRVWSCK